MDLRTGDPYWLIEDGDLGAYPRLERDVSCGVAVIGAGVTGALVAYELARAGVSCVVLDKRRAGRGSTMASTSLLQYELDEPLHTLKEKIGWEDAARAYRLCVEGVRRVGEIVRELGEPCGFAERPSLYLASREEDARALELEHEDRARAGIATELLDRAGVEGTGSLSAPAALWSPVGAEVDSFRLTHALLRWAAARGAGVYEGTCVSAYRPDGSGVTLETEHGPRVRAGRVVFATGYEAQGFLREKLAELKSTYAVATMPAGEVAGWPRRCLIWETSRPYLYLRTTPEGRVFVGGEDEPYQDTRRRDALIGAKAERLMERLREMFPGVRAEAEFAWAGTFGETKDSLAYVGESPEHPRGVFVLGYGGNGMTLGVVGAAMARDLVLGLRNEDARLFRFGR